ncbi:MAG TPA: M23 family metallopeptidase [Thermoanaerobaculia bacterium]|nr:M23 family metallopeptidase [Thermoanaerobaculia bacterium]
MRIAVSFLVGCVLGATGVLLYLQETSQLAIAAEPRGAVAVPVAGVPGSTRSGVVPASLPPAGVARALAAVDRDADVVIPVAGIKPESLRSTFHERRGSRVHEAMDILAPRGTPVVAAVDGKVRKLFTSKAGGLTIYQYDVAEEKVYYYAHLDRYADSMREGLSVKKGDVIGYVGTTGNAPPGAPHLHFSISVLPSTKEWWMGVPVDPYPILTSATKRASVLR